MDGTLHYLKSGKFGKARVCNNRVNKSVICRGGGHVSLIVWGAAAVPTILEAGSP